MNAATRFTFHSSRFTHYISHTTHTATGRTRPFFRLHILCALVVLLVLFLLGGCARHQYTGMIFDDPQPAAPIDGTDLTGEPFHLSDHQGQLTLIFFGYTSCPDICPMTLANVSSAYKQLAEEDPDQVKDLTIVFVTVDPDRDTPERLAEYVPAFHPTFHGIYIPAAALEQVKSAYGVYAEKRVLDEGQSAAGYLVDHTAGIYLVNREGDLQALFKHDIAPDALAADLKALLKR